MALESLELTEQELHVLEHDLRHAPTRLPSAELVRHLPYTLERFGDSPAMVLKALETARVLIAGSYRKELLTDPAERDAFIHDCECMQTIVLRLVGTRMKQLRLMTREEA